MMLTVMENQKTSFRKRSDLTNVIESTASKILKLIFTHTLKEIHVDKAVFV